MENHALWRVAAFLMFILIPLAIAQTILSILNSFMYRAGDGTFHFEVDMERKCLGPPTGSLPGIMQVVSGNRGYLSPVLGLIMMLVFLVPQPSYRSLVHYLFFVRRVNWFEGFVLATLLIVFPNGIEWTVFFGLAMPLMDLLSLFMPKWLVRASSCATLFGAVNYWVVSHTACSQVWPGYFGLFSQHVAQACLTLLYSELGRKTTQKMRTPWALVWPMLTGVRDCLG